MVLARDEVHYVGQPVAVVIADTRHIAEDAAALLIVNYDLLDAVGDCRDGRFQCRRRNYQAGSAQEVRIDKRRRIRTPSRQVGLGERRKVLAVQSNRSPANGGMSAFGTKRTSRD